MIQQADSDTYQALINTLSFEDLKALLSSSGFISAPLPHWALAMPQPDPEAWRVLLAALANGDPSEVTFSGYWDCEQ